MKKYLKIYVVGNSTYYASFLQNFKLVFNIEEANVVLFTGGEDVDPVLYGKKKHYTTHCNIQRDKYEQQIFSRIKPEQVALGICRGSQFLCVMNGGLLVQNCNHHAMYGTHEIFNEQTGESYEITSTHHQMQYPYNLDNSDYTVLFKSKENRSDYHEGDGIEESILEKRGEPEIVLYHKQGLPKCLAVQGHPEMIPEYPIANKINNLLENLVYGE
jgi:gamma-glutamyl-gamma-aminobutyrate hydrolase PuuD